RVVSRMHGHQLPLQVGGQLGDADAVRGQHAGHLVAVGLALRRLLQIEDMGSAGRHLHATIAKSRGPFGQGVEAVERRLVTDELRQEQRRTLERLHGHPLDAIDCITLAWDAPNTCCAPHRSAGWPMATIYDIARHVGVSAGTVSRALSRPEKVLPATRQRIEAAAAALGYVPNTVARTLKTQRSGKILVTVPDIGNPFFAQILKGAEEAAQTAGYAV